jgi:hypothetical protein
MSPPQQQFSGQLYGLNQFKIEKPKNWIYFAKNPKNSGKHKKVNDNYNCNAASSVLEKLFLKVDLGSSANVGTWEMARMWPIWMYPRPRGSAAFDAGSDE